MKVYFNKIHYSNNLNPVDKLVKLALSVLTPVYSAGVEMRNCLYSKNLLKKNKLPVFVISVGNITTGGTGKTPITIEIAKYINEKYSKNVAVLSRGYGGKFPSSEVNVISDGENIFANSYLAGDEPYMIAKNLKSVGVITGKNRYESGLTAIDKFNAEVIILDDGFQHVKLDRDLNILVVDCQKKFGNEKVLPAGPLREPLSGIERADIIVVVNKNPFDDNANEGCRCFVDEIKLTYKKPTYLCRMTSGGIFDIKSDEEMPENRSIYAFAGIAQPEFFFKYLRDKGLNLRAIREFNDHHLYTEDDLKNVVREARKCGADSIVTTEKDAVKLSVLIDKFRPDLPFYALKLKLDLNLDEIIKL